MAEVLRGAHDCHAACASVGALLWNSDEQDERVEFVRHSIYAVGTPAMSNNIKGDQDVLKDLDTSFFDRVTYRETWLESFEETKIGNGNAIFEKLFKSLDNSERGLVLAP